MEIWLLLAAFLLGFLARAVGLPPLVGYLLAGFVLHAFGFETSAGLELISEIGILLLLFGIGLKLKLETLTAPRVWGTTLGLAAVGTLSVAAALMALGLFGVPPASGLDLPAALVVGFALSFSSTVFAVKALERANESASLAGRLAVGVLIIQDVLAVAFLVVFGGTNPTWWAIPAVVGLVAARPMLAWLLDRVGHGEVLVLFGITLAVSVGAGLFEVVGLKPDLGALAAGLLLAGHPRAPEMSQRLLSLKDLLLVAFFLSIGLGGTPGVAAWSIGLALAALISVRVIAYVWTFTRFRLRARTSLHASLSLGTYSEFGLIVAAGALSSDLIDAEWVSVIAVAVALSFVLASLVSSRRYRLYERFGERLGGLERTPIVSDDAVIDCGFARILVFGMGRVGEGAYDELLERRGPVVVGIDRSEEAVQKHAGAGRTVIRGDALDRDFWERIQLHPEIDLVVAAMSSHSANLECVRRVREFLPEARIAAIATYSDQVEELRATGVDVARNLYEEAGQGLADDAIGVVFEPDR